jgi:prepilin-type N-terminal cleavage/methylation domain-containing protein
MVLSYIKRKHSSGFALLELLAVLIIIAILVSIAVPLYASTNQTAKDRADEANVRILNSATLQWMMADEGNDPRTVAESTLKAELLGKFVQGWPVSPNGKLYVLGADGTWGTN